METQDIIFVFIAVIFIFAVIRQVLYWSWLWQLKEYRLDRMRAHFQDIGAKSVFLALIGYLPLRHGRIPKFTLKSALIIFFSFLAGIAILLLAIQNFLPSAFSDFSEILSDKKFFTENKFLFIFLIIGYLAMTIIVFCFVAVLNGASAIFKKRTINKARVKMAKFPNLKVIGITGSYGKSTTKEILAEILSKKFKTLKTPANINTAIGIAQLILDKLDESYEIFVVEMGAYKIGEIREICEIVKPKIGIITGINEQHLALFGSLKNTVKAKFELFDCLTENGLAILNIGDKNVQAGLEERKDAKASAKLYSVDAKSDVYATDIAIKSQSVYFKLISGVDIFEFKVNLAGKHNISNALAAIIAANQVGIGWEEISRILQRIRQLSHTLKISPGPNGSDLFDDTYNSNPDGVLADLDYLKNQKGRKVVVMSSLIELGSAGNQVHKKIGKEISKIARRLIFLDKYYFSDIESGIKENDDSGIEIKYGKNPKNAAEYMKEELRSGDKVLFIGRKAGKVLELLTRSTKAQG